MQNCPQQKKKMGNNDIADNEIQNKQTYKTRRELFRV